MWMSSSSSWNSKRPLVELAADAIEAVSDLTKLRLVEHAELRQGACVSLRLLDVE